MGFVVNIEYSGKSSKLDPKEKQLVIAGQPSYLKKLNFDEVSGKFAGRVSEEVSSWYFGSFLVVTYLDIGWQCYSLVSPVGYI